MKISFITATYNSFPSIMDSIISITPPAHHQLEYLIIDGGSKDQTLELLRESPLITKIVSERDTGIYDALNKGIRMATGDIIGFLHSDDLLATEDILEKIANSFEAIDGEKRIDGVYGDLVYVRKEDTNRIVRYWKSNSFRTNFLNYGWMPAHPSLFLRREVYEKHGLFDLQFKISADYDLMLRIFKDESLNFVYLPEVITKMRVGGMSNGSLKNIIRKTKEDYMALKKNSIPRPMLALLFKNMSKVNQFWISKHLKD